MSEIALDARYVASTRSKDEQFLSMLKTTRHGLWPVVVLTVLREGNKGPGRKGRKLLRFSTERLGNKLFKDGAVSICSWDA